MKEHIGRFVKQLEEKRSQDRFDIDRAILHYYSILQQRSSASQAHRHHHRHHHQSHKKGHSRKPESADSGDTGAGVGFSGRGSLKVDLNLNLLAQYQKDSNIDFAGVRQIWAPLRNIVQDRSEFWSSLQREALRAHKEDKAFEKVDKRVRASMHHTLSSALPSSPSSSVSTLDNRHGHGRGDALRERERAKDTSDSKASSSSVFESGRAWFVNAPEWVKRPCNVWLPSLNLKQAFHDEGINLRHLGLVRARVDPALVELRRLLLVEMVKRSLKRVLRAKLRHLHRTNGHGRQTQAHTHNASMSSLGDSPSLAAHTHTDKDGETLTSHIVDGGRVDGDADGNVSHANAHAHSYAHREIDERIALIKARQLTSHFLNLIIGRELDPSNRGRHHQIGRER